MLGLLPEDDANAIAQVCRPALPQLDHIWPHQGHERASVLQYCDFRYFGRAAIDPLEVFGDHFFPAAQHQDFLCPAGDEQETIPIYEAQITSPKPSVQGEGSLIGLPIVEVAFSDRTSTQLDLTDPLSIGVRNSNLAVGERAPGAAEATIARAIAGEQ